MGSNNCMNEFCRTTTSSEWKKGWTLKSGGFVTLCYSCGCAYENAIFCETFHLEESGWRDCKICRKRLHCGCIASKYLHEYMDFGGVGCVSCVNRLEIHQAPPIQISANIPTSGTLVSNGIKDVDLKDKINGDKLSTEKLLQLTKTLRINDVDSAFQHLKQEDLVLKTLESGKRATSLTPQQSLSRSDGGRTRAKEALESSFAHPSLNFTFASPLGISSPVSPFPLGNIEGSENSKSSLQQGQRARPSLQKPPKPSPTIGSDCANKGSSSQVRVARPPVDGRGRNQLLPRYWPKITDQELQQLSGDLNSNIVPLFEKILSASDAGRIGRLVLPKACAEAYFPTINQSEGIPIRIQDIKGKEWTFQFRFWPNNNSRMYVLEGVTPCIQNMQLQAGDTVTFSRRDPGGQLVIGCRKSSTNVDTQDPQTPAPANNGSLAETPFWGATENQHQKTGTSDDSSLRHVSASDKKKAKNIKNKRLYMHSDDTMELRITWEDAQELLRPSPSSEATFVLVEDHEFEEFEEPPVFGKKTIFISRPSGEHEQLVQCDSCLKWRRLPVHALLSANWTCSENIWDSNRYTCSTPEDINPRDLKSFFKDSKKRKISDSSKTPSKEGEPSGLDALATVAALGDNMATTRHPRHRPGCSCIVCIQPPSGKGKHEPTCKCNVCLMVRRRFKTLMLRKKKRMSEKEAELNQGKGAGDEEDMAGHGLLDMVSNEDSKGSVGAVDDDKGKLDLNSDPHWEDDNIVMGSGEQEQPCLVSGNVVAAEENHSAAAVREENKHEDG